MFTLTNTHSSSTAGSSRVKTRAVALAVASLLAAGAASATNYAWTGGNYFPSFPSTLLVGDTLTISATSGTPVFNGTNTFTNNGTVFQGSVNVDVQEPHSVVINNGTWDENGSGTGGLFSSFGHGLFANSGTIETTGTGNLVINNGTAEFTYYDNGGTLNAAGGQIKVAGPNATFSGTTFEGAAGVSVTAGANFNGTVTSIGNALQLASGTFISTGTTLGGSSSAIWSGGTLNGAWTIGSAATLNVQTGVTKALDAATLTNNGTLNWGPSDPVNSLAFSDGASLVNNGTLNVTVTTNIGAPGATNPGGSIINNGLLQKTGGSGITVLGSSAVSFTNSTSGIVQSLSGTIQLPSAFVNIGTLAGDAAIAVPGGLTNNGTIVAGVVNNQGQLQTPGALSLQGSLIQGSNGTVELGMLSSTNYSTLNVLGSVTAGGTLDVICVTSCNVAPGSYEVLTSTAGITGMFSLADSGFAANDTLWLTQNGNNLFLNISQPVPLPASQGLLLAGIGAGWLISRRRRALA